MPPKFRLALFAALTLAVAACSKSPLADLVGISAHNVFITPGAPQATAGGDSVYFSIVNEGAANVYIRPCGDAPQLDVQVQENGAWQDVAQGTCPVQTVPGPIEVDIGATIVTRRLFTDSGHYRVGIYVATDAQLSDGGEAWTIGFDVP